MIIEDGLDIFNSTRCLVNVIIIPCIKIVQFTMGANEMIGLSGSNIEDIDIYPIYFYVYLVLECGGNGDDLSTEYVGVAFESDNKMG